MGVVDFVDGNPPPFDIPLYNPVLCLLLWLLPFLPQPDDSTDRCPPILDLLTRSPRLQLFSFLSHHSPLALEESTLGIISRRTLQTVSAVYKLFLRNGGGGLPLSL